MSRAFFPLLRIFACMMLLSVLAGVVCSTLAQAMGKIIRGDVLAFSRYNATIDIYLLDVNNRLLVPFLNSESLEERPVWSPDAHQIVYNGDSGLSIIDAAGGESHLLLDNITTPISGVAWHPTNNIIAFSPCANLTHCQIHTINAAETQSPTTEALTEVSSYFPDWSPDGQQIVFSSASDEETSELFVMNLEDNNLRQLTFLQAVSGAACWSPDGRRIVFASGTAGDYHTYILDLEDNRVWQLLDIENPEYSPVWSSDGNQIYFVSNINGSTDIYSVNVDGTHLQQLTHNTQAEASLDLMP
jgi:Tol biopolymer transport system component